mmetsp:Transcript_38034/g.88925  ORF Transcript_38034/g.88925 Transcript_38034/m.88925 type:complete len:260 (-) Transcript_38034:29-808(-)
MLRSSSAVSAMCSVTGTSFAAVAGTHGDMTAPFNQASRTQTTPLNGCSCHGLASHLRPNESPPPMRAENCGSVLWAGPPSESDVTWISKEPCPPTGSIWPRTPSMSATTTRGVTAALSASCRAARSPSSRTKERVSSWDIVSSCVSVVTSASGSPAPASGDALVRRLATFTEEPRIDGVRRGVALLGEGRVTLDGVDGVGASGLSRRRKAETPPPLVRMRVLRDLGVGAEGGAGRTPGTLTTCLWDGVSWSPSTMSLWD